MAEQEKDTKVEDKATTPEVKAEKAKDTTKAEKAKVYKFKSANKFLTCAGLGVQFINGEATTTKLEVAKALSKLDGVELIEK